MGFAFSGPPRSNFDINESVSLHNLSHGSLPLIQSDW
jgi:hypothetical protein